MGEPDAYPESPGRRRHPRLRLPADWKPHLRGSGEKTAACVCRLGSEGLQQPRLQRRGGDSLPLALFTHLQLCERTAHRSGTPTVPGFHPGPGQRLLPGALSEPLLQTVQQPQQPRMALSRRSRGGLLRRNSGSLGLARLCTQRLLLRLSGLGRRRRRLARGAVVLGRIHGTVFLLGRRDAQRLQHQRLHQTVLRPDRLLRDVLPAARDSERRIRRPRRTSPRQAQRPGDAFSCRPVRQPLLAVVRRPADSRLAGVDLHHLSARRHAPGETEKAGRPADFALFPRHRARVPEHRPHRRQEQCAAAFQIQSARNGQPRVRLQQQLYSQCVQRTDADPLRHPGQLCEQLSQILDVGHQVSQQHHRQQRLPEARGVRRAR